MNAITTITAAPTEGVTIETFEFNGLGLRAVRLEGEPWFVAKDVCDALTLDLVNNSTTQHLATLRDDEKQALRKSKINLATGLDFPNRGMTIISESGLYRLILRSDKPEAREFQDWVTRVVLPTIRKTGGYIMGEEKLKASCFRHVAD